MMVAALFRILPVLAVMAIGSASPSCAESLTAQAAMSKLRALGFPMALLSKIHVNDLGDYASLDEDVALKDFQTRSLFGHRTIDGVGFEDVTLTFYDFPSAAVRDAELAKRKASDADAINNSYHDIYYYLDPTSAKAFRAERWRLQSFG